MVAYGFASAALLHAGMHLADALKVVAGIHQQRLSHFQRVVEVEMLEWRVYALFDKRELAAVQLLAVRHSQCFVGVDVVDKRVDTAAVADFDNLRHLFGRQQRCVDVSVLDWYPFCSAGHDNHRQSDADGLGHGHSGCWSARGGDGEQQPFVGNQPAKDIGSGG